MFLKRERKLLDVEMDRVISVMETVDPTDENYATMAANLVKLSQAKTQREVDPNVVISAVSSIVGILSIISYEHLHVITSKAISFVAKTRV